MKILLLTPPLVQLNTPYPATAYLTGYLRSQGFNVAQADPALMWVLRLFSRQGLSRIREALLLLPTRSQKKPAIAHFLRHADGIAAQMPHAVALLQNRDHSLIHRIANRKLLPEGGRFSNIGPLGHSEEYLDWAFGSLGVADRAKYFASLFIEDVVDAVREGIDPFFDFARYGEQLAASQATFDPLLEEINTSRLTAGMLEELTLELLREHQPDVVGMSLPFPGNVLGALRMARTVREQAPACKITWGGGYVNTELRDLRDPRVFDFVDAVTYDDGERPLQNLLNYWAGSCGKESLLRTRLREEQEVVWYSSPNQTDVAMKDTGTPTYDGLPLRDYLSLIDLLNPMHRLWSDTRWNKLTIAHGCYWKKCSFCDLSLNYINHYEPLATKLLVDRIEAITQETGEFGFHFVDEAAPPAALRGMAEEIIKRGLSISWWGNIRFEKTFNAELCGLLAASGCIAISGGLEVASDRLLKLMQKGVSVAQVARVTKAFVDAGIRVHAYLMYGFPSQNEQETVDSLEMVRQLFAAGCLDSAYWHRFSATAHAPIGMQPERYGLTLREAQPTTFARNDLAFKDAISCDHEALGVGLRKSLYNYMHGLGLEQDVRTWFDHKVPKTRVTKDFISKSLNKV